MTWVKIFCVFDNPEMFIINQPLKDNRLEASYWEHQGSGVECQRSSVKGRIRTLSGTQSKIMLLNNLDPSRAIS
jgi:hypothetical protein